MQRFQLFCVANNRGILERNLLASPDVLSGAVPLSTFWHRTSASSAYAEAIAGAAADYMMFVHQDVYLPSGWLERLKHAILQLDAIDPAWAVCGLSGRMRDGTFASHLWDSGLGAINGGPFHTPVRAATLDELLLVVRADSGVTFDPGLPGFHLYGTDIVLEGEAKGRTAYVIDAPVIHNARPISARRLGRDYEEAYRYVARKWRSLLPWPTVILELRDSPVPLVIRRVRNWYWRLKVRLHPTTSFSEVSNPAAKAGELGFDALSLPEYAAAHPIPATASASTEASGIPKRRALAG